MRRPSSMVVLVAMFPALAIAQAPDFDRPGIAFATSTLPPGSFDWELGVPDAQRDSTGGVRSTVYSADATLRIGLAPTVEVQIAAAPWNLLQIRDPSGASTVRGAGDTRIAVKWAPALRTPQLSIAFLAGTTVASGARAFSGGENVYSLGATAQRDLGDGHSLSLYANASRASGITTWTVSPHYGFPLGPLSAYVEAGHTFGGGTSSTVAGGGLAWLLHDRMQLDLYALRGLSSNSPDLQAGFGVSMFWK